MTRSRDLVVIGASAGGLQALMGLLAGLPANLPASVVVVLHTPAGGPGGLATVLNRFSPLPVGRATHQERLTRGRAYVASPNAHLLIHRDHLLLTASPPVKRVRPAVDPLFRSAARWYGPRVIGIVLSGTLDDGAAGLAAIGARGGVTLVQEPQESLFNGMPNAALAAVPTARRLPVLELAAAVTELAGRPVDEIGEPDANLIAATDLAEHTP